MQVYLNCVQYTLWNTKKKHPRSFNSIASNTSAIVFLFISEPVDTFFYYVILLLRHQFGQHFPRHQNQWFATSNLYSSDACVLFFRPRFEIVSRVNFAH